MNARRQAIRALTEAGYILVRQSGGHDIYFNPSTNRIIPLRRSFNDSDLKVILKEIRQNEERS